MYNEIIAKLLIISVCVGVAPILFQMIGDYLPQRKVKVINKNDYERFQ